jgi:hypothetical protein
MENLSVRQQEDAYVTREALSAIVDRLTSTQLSQSGPSAPKFREPRSFNGKADQVDPFLREIDNALTLQRHAISTERDKTRYFSLYLADGISNSWWKTIERSPEKRHLLEDFTGLIKEFKEHFDEPDRYAKALRKLRKLCQTGSAADYTARFLELVSDLNWTDQTKIQHYFDGLKDAVQDTLINRKGRHFTEDFVEFYKLCVSIDNELHELAQNRKSTSAFIATPSTSDSSRPSSPSFPSTDFDTPPVPHSASPTSLPFGTSTDYMTESSVANSSNESNPDIIPMEIDALRHVRLTPQEQQRRRSLGLCFYCGLGRHLAADCPQRRST